MPIETGFRSLVYDIPAGATTVFLHEILRENKCLENVLAKAPREKLKHISDSYGLLIDSFYLEIDRS